METNAITNESYAAQKRDVTSSANEHERKSRSGKRVKAHDTIPENHPIRLKKQNNVGAVGYQNPTVMPSTEPAPKKTKPRKRKPGVEPIEVESVKPAEILQAPVHQCSLGQLMAIPGLRTELFKMTRKKQKNPRSNVQTMQFFEDSSPQGIIKAKQVKGGGAPRTEVIVGGAVKLDAILDGGASSCIMSSKLVKTLNIETLEPAESIHGMADGRTLERNLR
ncbi:hypothetical protein G6F68_009196 [Rhizopus microsporus]|nr:hypothetical protein G6F68_009196 [Rhizopus microsporus]